MKKNSHRDRLSPERLKNDTIAHELVSSDVDATRHSRLPLPSSNPATNLIITEIALRALSIIVRNQIETRVAEASYGDKERAKELVNGRTIVSTLALYGAGKLATRSPLGLGIVATTLVGKTLYDRGRTLQRRRHSNPLRS
ncbi:MAG: hypothetical protein WA936_11150 [Erythrobacter sp.]